MKENFDLQVQAAALKVVQDYEKVIRRERLIKALKRLTIAVVGTAVVVHCVNKYNEEEIDDEL